MQSSIHFRHTQTGERQDTIWNELRSGAWKNIVPQNLLNSHLILGGDISSYKPVLRDFYLMHKGMLWDESKLMPYDPIYIPERVDANLEIFLNEAHRFFKQYEGKQLGVQLSGGLDSSIIIGLLHHFKIPFKLIGLANKRFEFRTESHIQNILSEWGEETILIDYETCLPYSSLNKIPMHQYPEFVRSFGPEVEMSNAANKLGVDILLTGQGGDDVFSVAVQKSLDNINFMPHRYFDCMHIDLIYKPSGINLVPFYADKRISELIYNLRLDQKEDIPKVWARQFFKDFLPRELVNYTYHSDFWGFVISGVQEVMPKLPLLFEQTYDLTHNKYFNKEKVKELMAIDLLDHKKETYMQIEPLLGIAVWIDTLVRGGIIK